MSSRGTSRRFSHFQDGERPQGSSFSSNHLPSSSKENAASSSGSLVPQPLPVAWVKPPGPRARVPQERPHCPPVVTGEHTLVSLLSRGSLSPRPGPSAACTLPLPWLSLTRLFPCFASGVRPIIACLGGPLATAAIAL